MRWLLDLFFRNFVKPPPAVILVQRMSQKSDLPTLDVSAGQKHSEKRASRVKLRGSVLILIRLPNRRQVRAALHQLSITGGLIHLEKPLDEKIEVELIFHLEGATIRGQAQMLFPMWATQGWLQPFRFTELSEASRESLSTGLTTFLGQLKTAAAGV